MTNRETLFYDYRAKQEKYVYYIIALTVACVAYSTNLTLDKQLTILQIPLALAISCWVFSIYKGLSFVRIILSSTYHNIIYHDVLEGNHELSSNAPNATEILNTVFKKRIKELDTKGSKIHNLQHGALYLGMGLFFIWRVLEMLPVEDKTIIENLLK